VNGPFDRHFGAWVRVFSAAAALAGPVRAADGERIRLVLGERSFREIRITREVPGARIGALVRDHRERDDELRVGLELAAGAGRLALGHQRDLDGSASPGWGSALGSRHDPTGPALSLARSSAGVSWCGPVRGLAVQVGAGRRPSGAAVSGTRIGVRGLAVSVRVDGPRREGRVAAAGTWAGLPARAEASKTGDGWRARAGLGGSASPLGLLLDVGPPGAWRAAAGLRAGPGVWRGTRAEVGIGSSRSVRADVVREHGPWRLASELRVAATARFRARVGWRRARLATELALGGPAPSVALRVESGPPRTRRGMSVELPAGRARRVVGWLAWDTPAGRVRVRVERNRGEPDSVDLEWTRGARRPAASRRD